jgi:hypothetical protein
MHRRDLLRLLAGLPLVLGLPDLARADDAPEPTTLATALARARARGRPVLLLTNPRGQPELTPNANHARRARLARHVDELLSAKDEATRLLVANLVVVIAPLAELEAALGADLPRRPDPRGGPLATGPTWLLRPAAGPQAELVEGAFDGDDAAAASLVATLRTSVLGGADALAPRRELELKALGAERGAVERDLQALGAATPAEREAASTRLAPRADALAATLTHLVVCDAPSSNVMHGAVAEEVRDRAKELVLRAASAAVPVGASWGQFTPGCGADDPYEEAPCMVECGMAKTSAEARRYLHVLAQ